MDLFGRSFEALFPPAVGRGDLVGIAALSGPASREAVARGTKELERLGFEVRQAANLDQRWHLFSGDDDLRAAEFNAMVSSREVKAIFFMRGGHGCLRILEKLDWESIQRNPKAYIGYSDVTPLLNRIAQLAGLVTFHGPMVATDLSEGLIPEEEHSLLGALAGEPLPLACTVVPGAETTEGTLLGGCLTLLASTQGTDFSPDLEGSILFLEDVNEPLYRLDRMLTQMGLSGSLAGVKGMILGHLEATDVKLEPALLQELLEGVGQGVPILATGLECGHARPNLTVPIGAHCRFSAPQGKLIPLIRSSAGGHA